MFFFIRENQMIEKWGSPSYFSIKQQQCLATTLTSEFAVVVAVACSGVSTAVAVVVDDSPKV